ncbi:MAG TPA: DUF3341 domain-containing protein [Bacteroidia bacterium]|jgi:hypothetical protein
MSDKKVINALYGDDEIILNACRKIRSAGFRIREVFSPFPIHGIDPVLGVPRTRIAICAFLYGITGTCLATLMMWYMMIYDWPTDVGGKPQWSYYLNVPAFIPITFEATVLCAAHGMAITFFLRSWILPGVNPKNPDPRTTDDKFVMQVVAKEGDVDRIVSMMKETGAEEVNID